jgi:hypothetical protein
MKRNLIILFGIILQTWYPMVYTYSQITIEHTYNGWASVTNLANSGYKYHVIDTEAETLKLYNTDHSLWKTVNLSVPAGYTLMTNVYNVSEDLFTLDGKVCFSYSYYTTTPSYQIETRIINENGTILLTIPGATYAYAYDVDGEAKLLAYITNYSTSTYTTKVYDLPGNFITGVMDLSPSEMLPFPNPGNNIITIPYSSEKIGGFGEIRIFNLYGICVQSFNIDNQFDHLLLNTEPYTPGEYIYEVLNPEGIIDSGKITVW